MKGKLPKLILRSLLLIPIMFIIATLWKYRSTTPPCELEGLGCLGWAMGQFLMTIVIIVTIIVLLVNFLLSKFHKKKGISTNKYLFPSILMVSMLFILLFIIYI